MSSSSAAPSASVTRSARMVSATAATPPSPTAVCATAATASPAAAAERPRLSEALEDYLEIIFALAARRRVVRVRDIARTKQVRMPTVTAALKRLAALGLVAYQAREDLALTEDGASIARRITGRHRFLVHFLSATLGVSPSAARRDACGLEHHLSAESLERLTAFVEYIETCPEVGAEFLTRFHECFGQPTRHRFCRYPSCRAAISPGSGARRTPHRGEHALVAVSDLSAGDAGEVARIQASEQMRLSLQRRGLVPGVLLEVVRRGSARRAGRVRIAGHELRLRPREAQAVFVDTRQTAEGSDGRS